MSWIKKHWLLTLFGFLMLLFVISAVLRLITPRGSTQTTSIQQPPMRGLVHSDFTGVSITFSFTPPALPANLPTYSVQTLQVDPAQLAAQLHLQPGSRPNTWVNSQTNEYLLQDPYSKRISYSNPNQMNSPTIVGKIVNKDQSITAATAFVQNQLHLSGLTPDTNNISYYLSGTEDTDEASPDKANILAIPFVYQANKLPVYSDIDLNAPAVITVNSLNMPSGFSLSAHLYSSPTQIALVATLPIEKIKDRILANNVSVIKITSDASDGFTIQNLKAINVSSLVLEYRLNSNTNQVLPYYHLVAQVINKQDHPSQIEFITPAVITTNPTSSSP